MVIKVGQSTWILVPNILVFYHFFKLLVNFSIFLNFLHFGEGEGEDQKRLVGLRRASAAGKNLPTEFAAIWNGLNNVRKHEFCKSDENWFIFVTRVTWETSDMFALGLLSLANRDDAFEHFCRPSKIDPELIYVTWCD